MLMDSFVGLRASVVRTNVWLEIRMSGSRGGVCARPPDFSRTSISDFPQKVFFFFF